MAGIARLVLQKKNSKKMKKLILALLVSATALSSCKKEASGDHDGRDISKFSYSDYAFDKDVEVTSETGEGFLTFTFAKPGMELKLPTLYVTIADFKGPGTYGSADGVTVYGSEGNDDTYWSHDYSFSDLTIRSHAKIIVKRADTRLVAEIEGELLHREFTGNQLIEKYTPFRASTDQRLYRR